MKIKKKTHVLKTDLKNTPKKKGTGPHAQGEHQRS